MKKPMQPEQLVRRYFDATFLAEGQRRQRLTMLPLQRNLSLGQSQLSDPRNCHLDQPGSMKRLVTSEHWRSLIATAAGIAIIALAAASGRDRSFDAGGLGVIAWAIRARAHEAGLVLPFPWTESPQTILEVSDES